MNKKILFVVILLFFFSAIVYLPLIGRIGYMNDDWYLMYSAKAYGPKVFSDIFSVDRPARALIMIPAYGLFGENPLYYNLSAYAFRLISSLAFLWILRMLFPRQDRATFLAALLFLIYPGFLSQPNGIDYQSHFVGLAAAHLSIALTINAILTDRLGLKAILHTLSILFGLLYLSQMEWYIGFEFFRWGSVLLLSLRVGGSLLQKSWRAIRTAYPALLVPGIFLLWRIFFFQAERTATDVNVQFEQVRLYPLQTLYHWTIQILQDLFDVFLSAWVIPLSQLTGYIQRWGVGLAVILVGLVLYFFHSYHKKPEQDASSGKFTYEALVLGLFMAVGGLLPIAMVNRDVSFPSYSRYSLVSSAGVAVVLSTLLLRLRWKVLRNGLVSIFIFASVLTHHANTVKAVRQTDATNNFWWQVSWRIPQLEKNTTLIASYPNSGIEEDYFIWGPANLIYYPEKQNEDDIQPGVFAVLLNEDTVEKVIARERQVYDKRKTIITYANYRNILVITQPSLSSCVNVIDGTQPEYSHGEWDLIREVKPYSEIEHVLMDETPHTPPTVVFGPEPAHGWCYFYQKASLARQQGNWDEVRRLGDMVRDDDALCTQHLIEWLPYIQAYAIFDDFNSIDKIANLYKGRYLDEDECKSLMHSEIEAKTQQRLESLFCQHIP